MKLNILATGSVLVMLVCGFTSEAVACRLWSDDAAPLCVYPDNRPDWPWLQRRPDQCSLDELMAACASLKADNDPQCSYRYTCTKHSGVPECHEMTLACGSEPLPNGGLF